MASFQIALRNFGSWSFLNATTSPFQDDFVVLAEWTKILAYLKSALIFGSFVSRQKTEE